MDAPWGLSQLLVVTRQQSTTCVVIAQPLLLVTSHQNNGLLREEVSVWNQKHRYLTRLNLQCAKSLTNRRDTTKDSTPRAPTGKSQQVSYGKSLYPLQKNVSFSLDKRLIYILCNNMASLSSILCVQVSCAVTRCPIHCRVSCVTASAQLTIWQVTKNMRVYSSWDLKNTELEVCELQIKFNI